MNGNRWPRIIALVALAIFSSAAFGQASDSPDRLVKVKPRRMELAWLLPGADFRPYTKVIISQTQVAFRQNFVKDYNLNAGVGPRIMPDDAAKIMAAAQTNFDDVFADAFRKAGYEVVTTAGPDVLRVNSSILDLNVNAPLGMSSGQQVTFIITAGDAALIVEVRDTMTNALLGRVADRRATQDLGRQMASNATNLYDFRLLFNLWAGICVKALGELKAISPVPANLKPMQRL